MASENRISRIGNIAFAVAGIAAVAAVTAAAIAAVAAAIVAAAVTTAAATVGNKILTERYKTQNREAITVVLAICFLLRFVSFIIASK